MATSMNPHRPHPVSTPRTLPQKVCIGIGIFFIIAGLGGIVMPGMMGLHLSLSHNIIHLASGAIALWVGYSDDFRKSYIFCIAFGAIYGLLGLAGFILGNPGYPGVGHMEADDNLFRIIPNALELGTNDHILHILLSVVFLATAYIWKKNQDVAGRTVVDHQAGVNRPTTTEVFTRDADLQNSESDLKDANLGRSDINRRSDDGRRSDFERRI